MVQLVDWHMSPHLIPSQITGKQIAKRFWTRSADL